MQAREQVRSAGYPSRSFELGSSVLSHFLTRIEYDIERQPRQDQHQSAQQQHACSRTIRLSWQVVPRESSRPVTSNGQPKNTPRARQKNSSCPPGSSTTAAFGSIESTYVVPHMCMFRWNGYRTERISSGIPVHPSNHDAGPPFVLVQAIQEAVWTLAGVLPHYPLHRVESLL